METDANQVTLDARMLVSAGICQCLLVFAWVHTFRLQSGVRKASTRGRQTMLRQRKASTAARQRTSRIATTFHTNVYAGMEGSADLTNKVCLRGFTAMPRLCDAAPLRCRASATPCLCDALSSTPRLAGATLHCVVVDSQTRCCFTAIPRLGAGALHCVVVDSPRLAGAALCCLLPSSLADCALCHPRPPF